MRFAFGWLTRQLHFLSHVSAASIVIVVFVMGPVTAKNTLDEVRQAATADLKMEPISLAPVGAQKVITEEQLKAMADTVRRLEDAAMGIYHEVNRQQTLVMQNPYTMDPFVMDPFMQYGFDYSIDPDPMWTCNTGQVIPPRRENLDSYLSQINNEVSALWTDVSGATLPEESTELKVQWEVLSDTLQRMRTHCQWLQSLIENNTNDTTIIGEAAENVRDDAKGLGQITKNMLEVLCKKKG